jgi:hypothetical protein
MSMTAREALTILNFYGADARLPPPFDRLSSAEINARAREEALPELQQREQLASEERIARAPEALRRALQGRPKRPTPKRLQTYFLRQFERSGSVGDAAARAGVTPRTVQRWRATNPAFAGRYDTLLEHRAEVLEELALQRAAAAEKAPRFYRGKQIATVERHDNSMLMRVLNRFDRAREREQAKRCMDAEVERRVAAEKAEMKSNTEAYRESIERTFGYRVDAEVRKRISEMSPSMRLPERPFGGR